MTMVDDETARLWGLLSELSTQLSANRERCEELKKQCEQLKTQAVHTGTGFTLRRFNTDITKEVFESELERFNATLILENQSLQYENRQLSMLLKDYEGTLDNVMARFRGFAASTQQYELDSSRHYESLLLQCTGSSAPVQAPAMPENPTHSGFLLSDPLALQMSLSHLSSLMRKALRSLQGEDVSSSSSSQSDGFPSSSSSSSSSDVEDGGPYRASPVPTKASRRRRHETPKASQPHPHKHHHDEGEGGYLRLLAESMPVSEAALERDIELERLQKENDGLRQLLGVTIEMERANEATLAKQAEEEQARKRSLADQEAEGRKPTAEQPVEEEEDSSDAEEDSEEDHSGTSSEESGDEVSQVHTDATSDAERSAMVSEDKAEELAISEKSASEAAQTEGGEYRPISPQRDDGDDIEPIALTQVSSTSQEEDDEAHSSASAPSAADISEESDVTTALSSDTTTGVPNEAPTAEEKKEEGVTVDVAGSDSIQSSKDKDKPLPVAPANDDGSEKA